MNNLFAGSSILVWVIVIILLIGAAVGFVFKGPNSGSKVLSADFSAPLNGATSAKIDLSSASGNLTVDRISGNDQELANGTVQYVESQGAPTQTLNTSGGQATFALKSDGKGKGTFHLPWEACNALTEWAIHLNPAVAADITAHSGGGNVKLNFDGMIVTHVAADTGGGNMNLVLPENAANLNVTVKTGGGNVSVEIGSGTTGSNAVVATSGAGNVVVSAPAGMAVRVHAKSGAGKVMVDPRFTKVDDKTYQTVGFDSAADKVEITAQSGAGNVSINIK
jgi:DUF4097 and DUF4098 domain-containing protein YvlB